MGSKGLAEIQRGRRRGVAYGNLSGGVGNCYGFHHPLHHGGDGGIGMALHRAVGEVPPDAVRFDDGAVQAGRPHQRWGWNHPGEAEADAGEEAGDQETLENTPVTLTTRPFGAFTFILCWRFVDDLGTVALRVDPRHFICE